MGDRLAELRERVRELMVRGELDLFIGYEPTYNGTGARPAFFTRPDELDRLILDQRCWFDLAPYLLDPQHAGRRIGLVVKGCDSRGLQRMLSDHRVDRDRLTVFGWPCTGVVGRDGHTLARCEECDTPNPLLYDELLGQPVEDEERSISRKYAGVLELENRSHQDKYDFWTRQFSRCLRCYACRNVCPACSCLTCSCESTEPEWVQPRARATSQVMFHFMRAYHLAGRCIDCGMCEEVCPMDIPLALLNRKLMKDVEELFDMADPHIPGDRDPLGCFASDDPDFA